MHIRLGRGLKFASIGSPSGNPDSPDGLKSVGLSGLDYPGVRPEFLVEPGESVITGQALLRDRGRPDIVVASPVTGTVTHLARRDPETLAFLIGLTMDSADPAPFAVQPDWRRGDAARRDLLASGLWASLLERPFGRVPDPDAIADTILVTASSGDSLSPDPRALISGNEADFATGVDVLSSLTRGSVHVCQDEGPDLSPGAVTFSGGYPAGLPGTHVHHIYPVDETDRVWTVNYQDTMAIGHLFNSGLVETRRTVALAGPGVKASRLLRVPLGACIDEVIRGRLRGGSYRIVSGPVLFGRDAQYLGRCHLQICALPASARDGPWRTVPRGGAIGPIIPVAGHQQVFPFDLPVVPLLRALAVGDSETAKTLGCLELLEEDVAVLSYVCPSGNDYAPLLRSVLDDIRRNL